MAFVSSLDKVIVASWTVAVLAFAGRGFAGLWRAAAWAELRFSQGSALVLLAVSTLPHSPFVSLSPGCQDTHKFTFLKSVYVLCKTALKRGLTQGLDLFCQTCKVVENIKVRGHPVFWGWGQAPPSRPFSSPSPTQGLQALLSAFLRDLLPALPGTSAQPSSTTRALSGMPSFLPSFLP